MEPKPNPSPSEDHAMTRQIDGPDSISQNDSSNETIHAGFWTPNTARFPVVCIGMSAGGVAPLQTLIRTLSPKTGMAFVVIHHLRQEHPTLLPEILSSCTSMPVQLAEPSVPILPNHIYILPSGQEMNLTDGAFALKPRTKLRGWSNVVTMFLNSLIESRHAGIAVILSGMDADGTEALKAFKRRGGSLSLKLQVLRGCATCLWLPSRPEPLTMFWSRKPWLDRSRGLPKNSD